jgi:DNA-binding transcriptional ArsR family regulator
MAYDYAGMVALSDPTRRKIFELVAKSARSVADLTRALPVSQPAVSQHLKVLREAKLVRSTPDGARSIYAVDKRGLAEIRKWLDSLWDDALDAYQQEINRSMKGTH